MRQTEEKLIGGKPFYVDNENEGMNGTSYSPLFKSDVVNIIYRNDEVREEYRKWLRIVQSIIPKPEEEFQKLMEESKKPFMVNYFLGESIYVETEEEAFALCNKHTIKVIGGGLANK